MNNSKEEYLKAKEKVENLKEFYIHLIVYILVNIALFVINIMTYPEYLWFLYSVGGWGIGIIVHGLSIKEFNFFGRKWEEKKIKEFMEKDEKKHTR